MAPTSRAFWLVLASVPDISTKIALPVSVSIDVTSLLSSVSDKSFKPSCLRQRLTFMARPPPSPADMLTLMAALALSAPLTMNLATRNCPAGTSCQPEGTCQFGLFPEGETFGAACPAGAPEPPIGGCEAGRSAWVAAGAPKVTDFRNSRNAGFC